VTRAGRALAAGSWALVCAGAVLVVAADLDGTTIASGSYLQDGFVGLAYPAVGALVIARHPRNPVGWIFCAVGLIAAAMLLTAGWVAAADSGGLAVEIAGWYETWAWVFEHTLAAVVLLLVFPSGRFASRAWKRVGVLAGAATAVAAAALALYPDLRSAIAAERAGSDGGSWVLGLYPEFRATEGAGLANPVGVEGAEGVLEAVGAAGAIVVLLATVAAALSLVLRLRRARGDERQQLKWVAWAAVLLAIGALATIPSGGDGVAAALVQAVVLGPIIALATGMAMLRHRLYDIDVVINRTLVYGALTATLAGAYVGCVLLLQLALGPLTEDSDLAIAGSTLAVAALFRPARARIQAVVDRRFFRRRYDAARTAESFGLRLRDEVDVEALGADLRAVVAETMQPAHVSVWLRASR
jgi:hypothetical protein